MVITIYMLVINDTTIQDFTDKNIFSMISYVFHINLRLIPSAIADAVELLAAQFKQGLS